MGKTLVSLGKTIVMRWGFQRNIGKLLLLLFTWHCDAPYEMWYKLNSAFLIRKKQLWTSVFSSVYTKSLRTDRQISESNRNLFQHFGPDTAIEKRPWTLLCLVSRHNKITLNCGSQTKTTRNSRRGQKNRQDQKIMIVRYQEGGSFDVVHMYMDQRQKMLLNHAKRCSDICMEWKEPVNHIMIL